MAKCCKCGKSEPVMKVICSECAERICANCKYHVYFEKLDLLMCRNLGGLSGNLRATDYCSRFRAAHNVE